MKLAVFTNQFPARVNTFFAQDIGRFLAEGFELEIFSLRPEVPELWRFVPRALARNGVCRCPVHYFPSTVLAYPWRLWNRAVDQPGFTQSSIGALVSACRFGMVPLAKTFYAAAAAAYWHRTVKTDFDFVLSYWGNYSATAALLYQRLLKSRLPYGFFLHAGTDLYRDQVYLREKLHRAEIVIVVCEFNRWYIRQLFPRDFARLDPKIRVHHLGVDLDELKFVAHGREPATFLAVGRHDWRKGFDLVLKAVREVKKSGQPVKLRLLGEGPATPKLRRLANKLGVSNDVIFEGWVPFEDVAREMQKATALIHAPPAIGDAVPTVIKEAMALGLPVIASDIAGVPELLDNGRCGMLIPPNDIDALAGAMRRLLSETNFRSDLAIRAREHAKKKFDAQTNGAALAEALRRLTSTRTAQLSNAAEREANELTPMRSRPIS